MYKQKNKYHLEKFKDFIRYIKKSFILIITALMLGMSNAMYDEEKIIDGNQNYIEQETKKE